MTTEVRLFDRQYPGPENPVQPSHDPVRSAFVPYSSGLLMNEMKSYMEWMSYRRGFSWMDGSWDDLETLYDYWPYLTNVVGDEAQVEQCLGVVCLLVRASDDEFELLGVLMLESPPDIELIKEIETRFPQAGVTRYNMALVPMELVYGDEHLLLSALHWWWDNGRTTEWRNKPYTIDAMLFWTGQYRDITNSLLGSDSRDVGRYMVGVSDILRRYGVRLGYESYHDPLLGGAFMEDLRTRAGFLHEDVTVYDVYQVFSGQKSYKTINLNAEEHLELRAILCLYPDDIQERLLSGVVTSIDPSDVDQIGVGLNVGNRANRTGDRVLRFESVLQPRPQSAGFTRKEVGRAERRNLRKNRKSVE